MELTIQQNAWLSLANTKANLQNELQAGELAVQSELNNYSNLELEPLTAKITAAKRLQKEYKEKRLQFTTIIESKICTPLMEFEKRNLTLIGEAEKHQLSLKLEAENQAKLLNAKAAEISLFKAHIENERDRIETEYLTAIQREINAMYMACLEGTYKPADIMETLKETIISIDVPKQNKFDLKHLTHDEAKAIYMEVKQFTNEKTLRDLDERIKSRFAMFEQDFANATAAKEAVEAETKQHEELSKLELQNKQAANNLLATASTEITPAVIVKRKLEVVAPKTENETKIIIATFMSNWANCNKYIRVKEWANLAVKQMADAIARYSTETGELFDKIKYTEVCK